MGHTMHIIGAGIFLAGALALTIIALINDKSNWWTVEAPCASINPGWHIHYGTLGYTVEGKSTAFSDKSLDICYPLRLGNGDGNTNLRYVGIIAVVVMAVSALFTGIAVIQLVFAISHSKKHAKRAAHSAVAGGVLELIGAILVLGWYIGVAETYKTVPPHWIGFAQVLALIAPLLSFVGAAILHHVYRKSHHGYTPF